MRVKFVLTIAVVAVALLSTASAAAGVENDVFGAAPGCITRSPPKGFETQMYTIAYGEILCLNSTAAEKLGAFGFSNDEKSSLTTRILKFLPRAFQIREVKIHGGQTLSYSSGCFEGFYKSLATNAFMQQWTNGVARFSPHEDQCFSCSGGCKIEVSHRFDLYSFLQWGIAVVIAVIVPRYTRSNGLVYVLGFVLGVSAGLLFVFYLFFRNSSNLSNIVILSTTAVVLQGLFWWFVQSVFEQYLVPALLFFLACGTIGFAVVYRLDITERDRTLVVWLVQLVAIISSAFAFPSSIAPFPASVDADCTSTFAALVTLLAPIAFRLLRRRKSSSSSSSSSYSFFASKRQNGDSVGNNISDDEGDDIDGISLLDEISAAGNFETPSRSRFARNKFLEENLGEEKAGDFIVRGASPYISTQQYDVIGITATERAERQLLREFERNSEHFSAVLSPAARNAMGKLIAARTANVFVE